MCDKCIRMQINSAISRHKRRCNFAITLLIKLIIIIIILISSYFNCNTSIGEITAANTWLSFSRDCVLACIHTHIYIYKGTRFRYRLYFAAATYTKKKKKKK